LSRKIRDIAEKLAAIDKNHPFRTEVSGLLMEKLYVMGLIPTKWDLEGASKVSASSFCRRRLPVVMTRNKMSENIKNASKLVEHGHVRGKIIKTIAEHCIIEAFQ
jgi:U3 small nucleolar ribonucleoprotein protein IMP3